MDYRRDNLNRQAMQALEKSVYQPAVSLAIEDEYTGSYKLLATHTAKQPTMMIADPRSEAWEKTRPNLEGSTIKQSDFPQDHFFGSPIMGV